MAYSLQGIYTVDNRIITNVLSTYTTLPLSEVIGHDDLVVVVQNNVGVGVACDVYQTMLQVKNLDLTQSLQDFAQAQFFSDLGSLQGNLPHFPRLDTQTGKYLNRMNVFDPLTLPGITVEYGRKEYPSELGATYRSTAKDLLLVVDPTVIDITTQNPQNWLVSVNGVFHKTLYVNNNGIPNLWVVDGFENIRQFRDFNLVVADTTTLGGHTIVDLPSDAIVSSTSDIFGEVVLKVPGAALTGKTTLFCFDGYMNILNQTYRIQSDEVVRVLTSAIDWRGQFINNPNQRFTSDIFGIKTRVDPITGKNITLDLSTTPDANDTYLDSFISSPTIPASTFSDPAFLTSRFFTNHTFLVVINNDHVYKAVWTPYNYGNDQGLYEVFSSDIPRGVMTYGVGKVLPYVITSSRNDTRRTIYAKMFDVTTDEYMTVHDPVLIASRKRGILNRTTQKFITITDLYSGPLTTD